MLPVMHSVESNRTEGLRAAIQQQVSSLPGAVDESNTQEKEVKRSSILDGNTRMKKWQSKKGWQAQSWSTKFQPPTVPENIIIDILKQGQCFGEVALLGASKKRIASVVAKSPCILLSLSRERFRNFMSIVPEAAEAIALISHQRSADSKRAMSVFSNSTRHGSQSTLLRLRSIEGMELVISSNAEAADRDSDGSEDEDYKRSVSLQGSRRNTQSSATSATNSRRSSIASRRSSMRRPRLSVFTATKVQEALRLIPYFNGLPAMTQARLLDSFESKTFEPGELITDESLGTDHFWVLDNGIIDLVLETPTSNNEDEVESAKVEDEDATDKGKEASEGQEQVEETPKPWNELMRGSFFGDQVLFSKEGKVAVPTIRARTKAVMLHISGKRFNEVLESESEVKLHVDHESHMMCGFQPLFFQLRNQRDFKNVPDRTLAQLASLFTLAEFKAGEEVTQGGQEVHAFYVIASGSVSRSIMGRNGRQILIDLLSRNEWFGGMRMNGKEILTGNCKAIHDTSVFYIELDRLEDFAKQVPGVSIDAFESLLLEKVYSLLRLNPLLHPVLEQEDVRELLSMCYYATYSRGEVICREGRKPKHYFVVVVGSCEKQGYRVGDMSAMTSKIIQAGNHFEEVCSKQLPNHAESKPGELKRSDCIHTGGLAQVHLDDRYSNCCRTSCVSDCERKGYQGIYANVL